MQKTIGRAWRLFLVATSLVGCVGAQSAGTGGGENSDQVGTATFELMVAPTGTQCLVLNAVTSANATVSKTFPLSNGAATTSIAFGSLPTGPTSFSGYAYNVACASVGSNQPTWQADPISVTILPGSPVSVGLTFRSVNTVTTSVNFVPNLMGVAGGAMSTVVATDGAPMQWGWMNSGTSPTKVPGLTDATAVTAGFYHACALRADGSVWCWGSNTNGQVGPGVAVNGFTSTAVQVPLSGPITMIAAGELHTCAYRPNPSPAVFCWGYNGYGTLGNNTTTQSATPVPVSIPGNFPLRSLAAGTFHNIAATYDGHLLVWGANFNGQLGDGTTTNRLTATYVTSVSTVQQVTAGYAHSCAVRADGTAACWGYNGYGELGDATTVDHITPAPIAAVIPGPLQQIVAGNYHTCARTTDGRVFCWGYNFNGEVGDLSGLTRSSPLPVNLGSATATALAAGNSHNCAVLSTGNAACWGLNQNGQIGDGTFNDAFGPVKVVF